MKLKIDMGSFNLEAECTPSEFLDILAFFRTIEEPRIGRPPFRRHGRVGRPPIAPVVNFDLGEPYTRKSEAFTKKMLEKITKRGKI